MSHHQHIHANWFLIMYARNYQLADAYPQLKEHFLSKCANYESRWLELTQPFTINQLLPSS